MQQDDIEENIEELAEVEGGGDYFLNEDLEEELFEEHKTMKMKTSLINFLYMFTTIF